MRIIAYRGYPARQSYFLNSKRPKLKAMLENRSHWSQPPINYLKTDGQYIVPGIHASPNDKIDRDPTILDIQKNYYLKIINLCHENNIDLYVIMMPTLDEELSSYEQSTNESFNGMINQSLAKYYPGHYYNFSNLPEFKNYTNYEDITHLTPKAANRFSSYLATYMQLR